MIQTEITKFTVESEHIAEKADISCGGIAENRALTKADISMSD